MDHEAGREQDARAFGRMFEQTYLRFHRRDERRSALSGTARGVLLHLALTGPLTVGEAARHLDRAQSVVSDIVTHLEAKGLLERQTDPGDRRRTLVWLTSAGVDHLERDREVLATQLLAPAFAAMAPDDRAALLRGLAALLAADDAATHSGDHPETDVTTSTVMASTAMTSCAKTPTHRRPTAVTPEETP